MMKRSNRQHGMPNEIATIWMEVGRLLRHRMLETMGGAGVNPLQIFGLLIIHDHDGLTMKEFASYLHISSPSATSLADRLVRLRLLTRNTDARNRKLVRLHLSPLGKKNLSEKMRSHNDVIKGIFSLLDARDRSDSARILQHLYTALLRREHA